MASSEPVHPLRISKNTTPMSSPAKKTALPRPLSEISPSEKRHNSPSWNQTSKKMGMTGETSPFQSSPMDATTSPRLFWQNRNGVYNSENLYGGHPGSTSPTRRSSIERLQKASRVKNSSILAQEQRNEYDPTRVPRVERPLSKIQSNSFTGLGITGGRQRTDSKTGIPLYNPEKTPSSASSLESPSQAYNELASSVQSSQSTHSSHSSESESSVIHTINGAASPSKEQNSPIKSSLSSRYKHNYDNYDEYNPESPHGDHDLPSGRSLHRHTKSVTFDAAPPQVNEYEMATPDLSSVGSNSREGSYDSEEDKDDYDDYRYHADHGHQDDSFDASLEDTDKTPVVGPDDWRHDSPDSRRSSAFNGSPMPDTMPSTAVGGQDPQTSVGSGDHRPLPPLPGMSHDRSNSASSPMSSTTEHMLGSSPRGLPSPPGGSFTKSDIQSIGNNKMTLEERLKLMMLSDDGKSAAELQRERRKRRGGPRDRSSSQTLEPEHAQHDDASEHGEEEDTIGDLSGLEEYRLPPRISRESILRRVNGAIGQQRESDYNFSSPAPSSPQLPMHPDVPIPSTEHDEDSLFINDGARDHQDRHANAFDANDIYEDEDEDSLDGDDYESSFDDEIDDENAKAADIEVASTPRAVTPVLDSFNSHTVQEDDIRQSELPIAAQEGRISLGETRAASMSKPAETHFASPRLTVEPTPEPTPAAIERPSTPQQKRRPKRLSKPEYDGSGWGDDEEYADDDDDEPSTPESVIHHPIHDDDDVFDDDEYDEDDDEEVEEAEEEREVVAQQTPAIPEQIATIKSASGSKLKTRASATPSDITSMREARRQVSREIPDIPAIPERHRSRLSRDVGGEAAAADEYVDRHPSFKKRSLTLDLGLDLSLDQDFDRVIEAQKVITAQALYPSRDNVAAQPPRVGDWQLGNTALAASDKCSQLARKHPSSLANDTNIAPPQQRGYLMRQNTKLVAASDKESVDFRGARSAGNSPIKCDRPQSWTVEPWNGDRKKSIRRRVAPSGPVPPMPGQQSNAATLNPLAEDETAVEPAADASTEEGVERGRLFVKVMGVKDLDLPISKTERTWFSLTLDNGVHCVTTAWLELARNAPIGQEFELLVPNELEFQLTLNVKLEQPIAKKVIAEAPVKTVRPKQSTFSRVFASPKKRKEMEMRMKEEEERAAREHHEAQSKVRNAPLSAYDLLSPIVAEDGSFARAYVCLKEHESRCYGRPGIVDITCFNEWATEEAGFASSVKSKRGNMAVVRRAPYKIGKLELQLLFVPRPKGISNDDMPKSMNSCIREMKTAEERLSQNWEGHLSQQGGDCPYWRRRYFKLVGTKLTAYHEATRQPRATINLANAKRLIDDRRALTERETTAKNGKRRRSGFAEEEEGYMFVEEGFRIRFNNGEVIDFYADTANDKDGWMKVLSEVISRDSFGSDEDGTSRAKTKWCEAVLKREEAMRRRSEGRPESRPGSRPESRPGSRPESRPDGRRVHARSKSTLV